LSARGILLAIVAFYVVCALAPRFNAYFLADDAESSVSTETLSQAALEDEAPAAAQVSGSTTLESPGARR
jgi:hypothetical protein